MKKTLFLMMLALGINFNANARPSKEVLICNDEPFSSVQVYLDSRGYAKGSGYATAIGATITHNYSGTQDMTCTSRIRFDTYDIRCAGYYWSKELTELIVKGSEDKIEVEWITSEWYGKTKKITPCILKEVKD